MDLKKRFILALLAIIMSNAMVSAKLTIAYVPAQGSLQDFDAGDLTMAKVRQTMIELYGDEWLKNYIKEIIRNQCEEDRTRLYIGNGNQLIFGGGRIMDKELLIMVKETLDCLSVRNDTIYITSLNFFPDRPIDEDHFGFQSIFDRNSASWPGVNKLYVGEVEQIDVKYIFYCFKLCTSRIFRTGEYKQACEDKGYLYLPVGGLKSEKQERKEIDINSISQEDIDFLVDCIKKEDKKAIEKTKRDPIQISKISYKYDKKAKVY